MESKKVCLILTATIKVGNIAYTERSNVNDRLNDYLTSFNYWIKHKDVDNIIFIENSGYDLNPFKLHTLNSNKNVEFLSYEQDYFNPNFGKGYGEKNILDFLVSNSTLLYNCESFIKISGRYIALNYSIILKKLHINTDIYCDLTKNLKYSESVLFGGTINFLVKYISNNNYEIDDSKGIYFEHFLAKCFLDGVKDGLNYQFFIIKPKIVGYSGTNNIIIKTNLFKNIFHSIITYLKYKLLKF